MRYSRTLIVAALAAVAALSVRPEAAPQSPNAAPTIDQFMGAASPLEVVAARKAERIAWIAYERGRRNVYVAGAPTFAPVKLSNFAKDEGIETTEVRISDDGST